MTSTQQPAAAEADRRGRGPDRVMLLGWACGAALAAAAMALPQERLIGEAFAGGHEHSPLWVVWHRFGGSVGAVLGAQGERVRFVVAALAYGACFPAALQLARPRAGSVAPALAVASLAALAPTAWLAGTTPGMTSIAMLLALLLLGRLLAPAAHGPWPALALWIVLVGTQVSTLLLWPAIALALLPGAVPPGRTTRACVLTGAATLALVVGTNLADWDPVPLPAVLDASATRWSLDDAMWTRVASIAPGLGVALLGLAALALRTRTPRRSWLVAWCALPLAALFLHSTLTWDASVHWLLPAAALGLAEAAGRLHPRSARGLALVLLAAQIALLVGLQRHAHATDPLAAWRDRTRALIDPQDTIITGDVGHAYLASHRWGLRSVVLRATDPEAPSTERVDGVYISPTGASNLRVKTQDVAAWANEGVEARGFGFRPVLDRPFPPPADGISEALERELSQRVDFLAIHSH